MKQVFPRTSMKIVGLIIGIMLLMTSFVMSLSLGQTDIPFSTAVEAFISYDDSSTEHIIVQTTRTPRAIIAGIIGASLAIAGALMQALTRNPLASPGLFGINAGAVFFVVVAAVYLSVSSLVHYMWIAFFGAALAGIAVYFLGSVGKDGLAPIKVVLAGAAISALFLSATQGILVLNENGLQEVLFWLTGSVAGRTIDMLLPILPYMATAGVVALLIGPAINVLLFGEDVAKGLGQRTILLKTIMGLVIIVLAGGSVAVAGSVGFVGLVIPHIARYFVGIDYRWVIPYCAVLGATLVLLADVAARFLIMPQEVPIGIMTAFVGAPFFIHIARKGFSTNG